MPSNAPDRLNLRVLLMVAILGALLALVGWYRYLT
jgi:hypothetical protein